jgi:Zn-dependent protease with chaperone function
MAAPQARLTRTPTLPTQTEAAFWLICLVLLGTLFAGLVGGSPIRMLPIVLTILILPARAVLARPDKELQHQDEAATKQLLAEGVYERLQTAVNQLALLADFRRPILLLISRQPREVRATGSWRRHYILLGAEMARKLDNDLRHPDECDKARALLLHEIGHLLHRDVQRIGYTGELLRSCFVVLPWWMFFLIGWLGAAYLSADAILRFDISQVEGMDPALLSTLRPLVELSPDTRAEIMGKMETISFDLVLGFIVNAFWPILVISFVLWLFYWRRMVRAQEYYADQLASALTQNEQALLNAFGRYPGWFSPAVPDRNAWSRFAESRKRLLLSLEDQLFHFSSTGYQSLDVVRRRFVRWFALHPTYKERWTYLKDPAQIHKDWFGTAVAITALVITLNVLLITPLISYHLMRDITHFFTLAIFFLLSTWLLPFLVSGMPFKPYLVKMLWLIFGVRAVFVLLDRLFLILLAMIAPATTADFLNRLILAIARYSRPIDTPPVDDALAYTLTHIPLYVAYQIFIPLGSVILLLFLYYRLSRLFSLRFVAAEDGQGKWRQRHWFTVIGLSTAVTALILVPLADFLGGDFAFNPDKIMLYLAGFVAGLALLIYYGALEYKYRWKPT